MTEKAVPVPHYAMYGLLNFLLKQGLDQDDMLAILNCELTELTEAGRDFTVGQYEKLLAHGRVKLGCQNLGFQYGKAFQCGEWGLLGHIVMTSKHLKQALAYQNRYQCLMSAMGRAYLQSSGEHMVLRWLSQPDVTADSVEQVITAWVAFAFANTITNEKPLSVHFVHAPMADEQQYRDFFGCEVVFNANFNGVMIREPSLHLPLVNQNPDVLNVLCCHAENLLAEQRANASLGIIHQFIVELLPTKVPELGDVAAHLGISTRQLQRKFHKEGTNLTLLLEEIRKNLAIAYLSQTDHKLLYISTMLGYSEQSAFQRAFKRWTGQTPQAFRLHPAPIE